MNKKLVISLSVILGVVLTAIILCFTVFTIKSVELDFRTSTQHEWNESELVEASRIPNGKCLLFLSTKQYEENLETNYPYLEVINIEKVFPSKIIVHLAEREEFFALKSGESTFFLDKDFKVLRSQTEGFTSTKTNPILLNGLRFDGEIVVGQKLNIKQTGMKRFLASMIENQKTLQQAEGFVKEIELQEELVSLLNEKQVNMTMKAFGEREIMILNIDVNLSAKIQRVFQTIPMLYESLVDNGDYTIEEVNRCKIVVGNQITNQDELYVHIYLDEEIITSSHKND